MDSIKWVVKNNREINETEDLADLILSSRGMNRSSRKKFLSFDYKKDLYDPFLLPDMTKAVKRIIGAIDRGEKIVIYGDYDIDGITSTTLLIDGLSQLGAKVSYYIPDRFEEGYGLNIKALKKLKEDRANLIITVDCGITAKEEILAGKKLGLDIIVTDHHNPGEELPKDAVALINPKLKSSKYPFRELAGVGVAFKLICALQQKLPEKMSDGREKWLLDLVALGTVCDAVDLIDENRLLVKFGLIVSGKTKRVGIRQLALASGVNLEEIDSNTLGFIFGPRLNAAGRLEHASAALELLLSTDQNQAKKIAKRLDELNNKRRVETEKITDQALEKALDCNNDQILVLGDKNWSHGIIGIVASRISERLHKPTILLQIEGESAKGSARSVGEFSIIDAISSSKKYLTRFGGHNFAAGMSLKTKDIDQFRKAINRYGKKHFQGKDNFKSLEIDLKISPKLINFDSLSQIKDLEPFGNGNKEPQFLTSLELVDLRLVGNSSRHVKLGFGSKDNKIEGIAFNKAQHFESVEIGQILDIVYKMKINSWQGIKTAQIEIVDFKLAR